MRYSIDCNLANARRVWRNRVQRAEHEPWSYHDFLTLLVTEEIAIGSRRASGG
jgi:hypothetical protein